MAGKREGKKRLLLSPRRRERCDIRMILKET
jgi:hypothetical protein